MAANQARGGSGKKSWRAAKPGASPAARTAGRKNRIWTTPADAEGKQAVRRHRAQVVIWSLIAAALIGGFIWWVVYSPVRTPLIVATVTVYDAPIPPNAWAKEDAERFGPLQDDEIVKYAQIDWDSREQGIDDLCAQYKGSLDPRMSSGMPSLSLVYETCSAHMHARTGTQEDFANQCAAVTGHLEAKDLFMKFPG